MAEQNPKNPPGPKVSPTRTIVSLVLLLVVGVVCIIELRAGFGQMMTGKAMAAKSEDGVFTENTPLEDAKAMLALAPSESIERDDPTEIVYRYEWFSLLRPLMGESSPQLFLVTRKGDNPVAVAFHTSAEDDPAAAAGGSSPGTPGMEGPPGPPGGSGAMMGGPPAGMMPPGGGMMPPGASGGPGRQRPASEGDAAETPSETPAETPAEAPAETPSETPSTDNAAETSEETPAPSKEDAPSANPEPETPSEQ